MSVPAHVLEHAQALALGFAFAGLVAASFELFTEERASFRLLRRGGLLALLSVPMLVFSGPFIIMKNTVRGRVIEARPLGFVVVGTVLALFWGLMCGRLVLDLALALAR